jgi:hypothetical protein
VADRVLDQWLQKHAGYERFARLPCDLDRQRQSAIEPEAVNLEVVVDQLNLAAQGNLVSPETVHGQPQDIRQAVEHAIGRLGVLMDHRRDGVERVEQKVWPKLRFQELKLKPRELPLAVAVAAEVVVCGGRSNDCPVCEEVGVESLEKGLCQRRRGVTHEGEHTGVGKGEQQAGRKVNQQRDFPFATLEPKPAR